MTRRQVIFRTVWILALVWSGVWGIRAYAGSHKNTAQRVAKVIAKADFADWSARASQPDTPEARRRDTQLRAIADLVNLLDFQEREAQHRNHSETALFSKLSQQEKIRYLELTVMQSFQHLLKLLDALPPKQRKQFIEQGLNEFSQGGSEQDVARAKALGADALTSISVEGMRAYFTSASAETKLGLAPLIEMVNEAIQGLRGFEFGHRRDN